MKTNLNIICANFVYFGLIWQCFGKFTKFWTNLQHFKQIKTKQILTLYMLILSSLY
jgi:hypothetical protein